MPQDRACDFFGSLDYSQIRRQIAETELWQAALFLAEQFSRTPQLQIFFRHPKPIGGLFENVQALPNFRFLAGCYQNAMRFMGASADTAPQLMELRQAELFGVFNHHYRSIGHADA